MPRGGGQLPDMLGLSKSATSTRYTTCKKLLRWPYSLNMKFTGSFSKRPVSTFKTHSALRFAFFEFCGEGVRWGLMALGAGAVELEVCMSSPTICGKLAEQAL